MRSILALVMVVNLAFSSGCSFIFVRPPPEDVRQIPPTEKMECTSGVAAPVIDAVIGAYQVFRTGYAIAQDESDYADAPISQSADVGIGIGLATLFVASTVYGFANTSSCADAERRHSAGRRPMPQPHQSDPGPTTLTFIVNPFSAPPPPVPVVLPEEAQAPAPQPSAPPEPEAAPAVPEPPAPERPAPAAPGPAPPSAAFPETQ